MGGVPGEDALHGLDRTLGVSNGLRALRHPNEETHAFGGLHGEEHLALTERDELRMAMVLDIESLEPCERLLVLRFLCEDIEQMFLGDVTGLQPHLRDPRCVQGEFGAYAG
jgi:hypothetical protein